MAESVRVFVLGSGSSGNALLLEAGGARIFVDAGIGPRASAARLATLGAELLPRGVDAILVTHEHQDHIGAADRLARALKAPVLLHPKIASRRLRSKLEVRDYDPGKPFRIGGIEVTAEAVPHDAPQVAVRFATKDRAFGLATDVGHVTPALVALLAGCDAAIIESNHCSEMLWNGPYPAHLKRRVAGPRGHLSNADAAELLGALRGSRLGRVWLGHLSRKNNSPERALETAGKAARGIAVDVLPHGSTATIEVRSGGPSQLALPFAS